MPTITKIKKDIAAQRRILLGAVVIALMVHGLLLILFVYKAPQKIYSSARTAGVTFMDLKNQEPGKRRQFLNWLEYHEPSLISTPDARYGYNQLNPPVKFRKAHTDRTYTNVLPEGTKNSLKQFEDLDMHKKPENDLSNNVVFHSFQLIPDILEKSDTKTAVSEIEYPLIKRDDKILHLSLSEQLFENSEKLKPGPMSIRYDLKHSKLLPRVMIMKSSGNRDFDLRVLRELALQLENIAGNDNEFIISIQWRKEETDK